MNENDNIPNLESFDSPGQRLKSELKERGLSQKEFADIIGMRPSHLSELITGKMPFTAQFALKLEKTLNIPISTWLDLQEKSSCEFERLAEKLQAKRAAISMLEEYCKYLDLDLIAIERKTSRMSHEQWLRFLVDDLHLQDIHKFQKWVYKNALRPQALVHGENPQTLITWIVLAMRACREVATSGTFSTEKRQTVATQLAEALHSGEDVIKKVKKVLSHHGIKFYIKDTSYPIRAESCSYWESEGIPVIVLEAKCWNIDSIAINLMRELWFICNQQKNRKEIHVYMGGTPKSGNAQERKAEAFAAQEIVPDNKWKLAPSVFINAKTIQKKYTAWAKSQGLNKWIVFGRIYLETGMCVFTDDPSRYIRPPEGGIYQ